MNIKGYLEQKKQEESLIRRLDLTESQLKLLIYFGSESEKNPEFETRIRDIDGIVGMQKPNISASLTTLEKRSLIKKKRHTLEGKYSNQRERWRELTTKGRQLYGSIREELFHEFPEPEYQI